MDGLLTKLTQSVCAGHAVYPATCHVLCVFVFRLHACFAYVKTVYLRALSSFMFVTDLNTVNATFNLQSRDYMYVILIHNITNIKRLEKSISDDLQLYY